MVIPPVRITDRKQTCVDGGQVWCKKIYLFINGLHCSEKKGYQQRETFHNLIDNDVASTITVRMALFSIFMTKWSMGQHSNAVP